MEDNGRVAIRYRAMALAAAACAAGFLIRRFPPDAYPLFYPVCPLRALTGWYCPGCGATHALAALLEGRFADAVHHNPLIVALAPVLAGIAAVQLYSALRWKRWHPVVFPPQVAGLALTAVLLFGLLRNLPVEPFRFWTP